MGRHYDEIDAEPLRCLQNLSGRVSADNVQFKSSPALSLR
jgi:hypothetical protein